MFLRWRCADAAHSALTGTWRDLAVTVPWRTGHAGFTLCYTTPDSICERADARLPQRRAQAASQQLAAGLWVHAQGRRRRKHAYKASGEVGSCPLQILQLNVTWKLEASTLKYYNGCKVTTSNPCCCLRALAARNCIFSFSHAHAVDQASSSLSSLQSVHPEKSFERLASINDTGVQHCGQLPLPVAPHQQKTQQEGRKARYCLKNLVQVVVSDHARASCAAGGRCGVSVRPLPGSMQPKQRRGDRHRRPRILSPGPRTARVVRPGVTAAAILPLCTHRHAQLRVMTRHTT